MQIITTSPVTSSSPASRSRRVYDLASVAEVLDYDYSQFPAIAALFALVELAEGRVRAVDPAAVRSAEDQFGDRIRLTPWPAARALKAFRRKAETEAERQLRLAVYDLGDGTRVTGARSAAAAISQRLGCDADGESWAQDDGTLVVPLSRDHRPVWAEEIRYVSGRPYAVILPCRRPRARRVH